MQVSLSEDEASHWMTQSVLQLRDIEAMSVLGFTLDEDSKNFGVRDLAQSFPFANHSMKDPDVSAILDSLSPFINHVHPEFCCAIFQSSFGSDHHKPSSVQQFYRLHRYSHLATTSLVRQLFAFGVHVPVIGIMLSGSRIAFHVDWATAVERHVVCPSLSF